MLNNANLNLRDSMLFNNSALDSNLHTFNSLADLIIAESATITMDNNTTIERNEEMKLSTFGLEVVRCSSLCFVQRTFFTSTA